MIDHPDELRSRLLVPLTPLPRRRPQSSLAMLAEAPVLALDLLGALGRPLDVVGRDRRGRGPTAS